MKNFTLITALTKAGSPHYPSHVRVRSARKMLLNAAYGRCENCRAILLQCANSTGRAA